MTRALLASMFLLIAPPAFAQTTYDLRKLEDRDPVLDESVNEQQADDQLTRTRILNLNQPEGQQVVKDEQERKGHEFSRTRTVRAVDAEGKTTQFELVFASFKDLKTGEELEVADVKVLVTKGPDGKWTRKIEQGDVPPPLAQVLDKELVDLNKEKKGKKAQDVMLPEQPVAVGATWKIDASHMAKEMGFNPKDLDADKCQGSGKLVSLTSEDGQDYLTVSVEVTITFSTFQGMPTKVPVVISISGTLKFSADGSLPNGEKTLSMTMKGTVAPADAPPGMVVEFDMKGKKLTTRSKN
tara:strand:- start:749 stop:1639 length:891 start_codon:yes stop_codon:yes gene_type:complete